MRLRHRRDNFLGDAVGEEFLLRVTTHVLEREHGDRGLVGQRKAARRCLAGRRQRVGAQLVDPNRPRDVFQLLLARVLEGHIQVAAHLSIGVVGDADTARLRDAFQPRSDVDAIAENITLLDHDVADMDTDAEFDALVGCHARVTPRHPPLLLDGAAGRVHGAAELDQNSIAGAFNDTAAVLRDRRLQEFAAVGVEPGERAFLVGTH